MSRATRKRFSIGCFGSTASRWRIIDRDETARYRFTYKSDREREILVGVIERVKQERGFTYWQRRGSRTMSVELTLAQHLEAALMFDVYRKAWAKAEHNFFVAFVARNEIFHAGQDEAGDSAESRLSDEDLAAIVAMASAMRRTAIPRAAIGAGPK